MSTGPPRIETREQLVIAGFATIVTGVATAIYCVIVLALLMAAVDLILLALPFV